MSNFINQMDEYMNNFSITENGAIAYKTSGKKLTDFNFKISYYRDNPDMIESDFVDLLESTDDIETIARYIFYIGDIREGLGERNIFRICLKKFFNYIDYKRVEKLISFIPEYNRWDSVWKIIIDDNELFDKAMIIINNQLILDLYNASQSDKPISLLAKWMPSENASSKETKLYAKKIRSWLNLSSKEYRLILSNLRKRLDIVERKISSNNWNEINYEYVPSRANIKYANSFLKHDAERRKEYLDSLKKGKVKINYSVLYPYEIIDSYMKNEAPYNYFWVGFNAIKKTDDALEEMWKALPKLNIKNTLVIRDGSGSMTSSVGNTSCLSVASSLAIYLSENNSGEWKDKFITFSCNPKIVDLSKCETLREKINKSYREAECSNTDIYKTMKLILNTAIKNKVSQEEMPEMILIISDMQFDGSWFHMDGSLFDNIKKEFEFVGYKLPKICFWNVDGNIDNTIPLQENEYGLILCSGFSINVVKMFLSDEINPYQILLDTLYNKRYNPIGEVFSK